MATPLHDSIELRAGDAWEIDCSLVDPDNNPLDIADATGLEWMMRDVNGMPCTAVIGGSELMLVRNQSPDTIIRLLVPAAASSTLNPGRYIDIFRVSLAGKPDSVAWGQILVAANGWEPPSG